MAPQVISSAGPGRKVLGFTTIDLSQSTGKRFDRGWKQMAGYGTARSAREDNPRFATLAARQANEDELESIVDLQE